MGNSIEIIIKGDCVMCRMYSSSYSGWVNGSGYSDPTAGKAIDRIDREMQEKAKANKDKKDKQSS